MDKAPDAFRTISEVAEVLDTPAHVLRFWESRFPQIKPVKRAGGRRYYRPADVALLSGIRQLLHAEGMTIRGVQKILREQGVRHVASLGGDFAADLDAEEALPAAEGGEPAATVQPTAEVHEMPRRPVDPDAAAEPPTGPSATIAPLFPTAAQPEPEPPVALLFDTGPATRPETAIPREGEGGFIAFTSPRKPASRPRNAGADDPFQPTLPFEPTPQAPSDDVLEEVPEAPHLWVDMEDETPPVAELHSFARPDAGGAAADHAAGSRSESAEAAGLDAETAGDAMPEPRIPASGPWAELPPEEAEPASVEAGHAADHSAPAAAESTPLPPPEASIPPLGGMAARLRTLGQVSASAQPELAELHSRLGLLHAQMAEAVRLRR